MEKEYLQIYYEKFFPLKAIYKWLKIDQFREISFCLQNGIYLRNLSFSDFNEFYERIRKETPEKIDVGAIYDIKPVKHSNKKAISKELIFDIDLTDYERNCCKEKNICCLCFPIIKVSVELLNYILQEELGFENLLFVFSGRRGVHCWITDEYAKKFSDIVRNDIVKYFECVVSKNKYDLTYTKIMRKYSFYFINQGFAKKYEEITEKMLYEKIFLKLDRGVTSKMDHLIKMPFCVHPSTGLLSIPINPNCLNDLNYKSLPSLQGVLDNPDIITKYIKLFKL